MADTIEIKGRAGESNTFLTTAQVIDGLLKMIRTGKVNEAADIYSRCQEDVGYLLVNKAQADRDLQRALANMFYRSRAYDKAALCCENLGEFAKAAALYEQDDDYRSAAEMYARVENFEKAAEMFERNDNHKQAAELYLKVKNFSRAAINFEKAVDFFVAGKLYHELGKYRKSMELLQKVQADHLDFHTATALIGDILARNGYPDLAIKKVLNVIKGRPVSAETAELYYHLAGFHRIKGNAQVAGNIYQQLLNFDLGYKDVEDKLRELGGAEEVPLAEIDVQSNVEDVELDVDVELPEGAEPPSQIVSVMEGFDFLQKIPLFEDMPLSTMKAFYNICEERTFQSGERLIEQGRPGMALYVIRSGEVAVLRIEGEKATEVTTLRAGEYVGEMALIDEAPTSARVVAKGEVMAFEVSRDRFLRFLQANDKFAIRVLRVFVRTMAQRLRETTAKLAH
ncbi:MAG: cyclic nucleotide-binding domain-containing protein [Deltaproteobacteria bacterium]|nr:cyclic nucleotide-binding domain-containing protein [Deltaproteobacteria bacterium]